MIQPLSAAALLAVWEANWRQPPLWQGAALVAAACPEERWDALLATPIGQINARLLTLYCWQFGPSLTAVTPCPGCEALIELTLDAAAFSPPRDDLPPTWLEITHEETVVRFRLPSLADLLAAGDATTVEGAAATILARCLATSEIIPTPELAAAVTTAMERADPLAVIEVDGVCPQCGALWTAFLDVASFLWHEVQRWAQRTLQEVHLLARAYGWREGDILTLTPARRQAYLQMVYG